MRELSIFIDESGDFGPYEPHAPYYLIALVFHNQAASISEEVDYLRRYVAECGLPDDHAVHAGPLVRREADYASLDLNARKKLFRAQFSFMRRVSISFKTFLFRKREFHSDHDAMVSRMSREIGSFVRGNLAFFQSFDRIVVYYDGGQKEITTIINALLNTLLEAEVKRRPSDYRLFQAADMICTLEWLAAKVEEGKLSKSEREFFGGVRNLKKNYLKPLARMAGLPGAR